MEKTDQLPIYMWNQEYLDLDWRFLAPAYLYKMDQNPGSKPPWTLMKCRTISECCSSGPSELYIHTHRTGKLCLKLWSIEQLQVPKGFCPRTEMHSAILGTQALLHFQAFPKHTRSIVISEEPPLLRQWTCSKSHWSLWKDFHRLQWAWVRPYTYQPLLQGFCLK